LPSAGRPWPTSLRTHLPLEQVMKIRTVPASALAAAAALVALAPVASRAETPDEWRYAATLYLWGPSIGMDTSFPTGGSSVDVTASDILNALNFAFMGAFSAQKGDWGLATDVDYLDLSSSKKATRDLTVGNVGLPVGVTAKADLGITGWLWTTVGSYRLVDHPDYTMDVIAGARLLNLSTDLQWNLTGDLGDPPLLDASGKSKVTDSIWDGVVGFKGRATFGEDKKWYVPYYFDIGTGDSDLTWMGMLGAGYAFGWGDLSFVWRYVDYEMSSKDPIQNLNFNGPALGFTFHF
jgi:hypothetical protein